MLRFSLGTEYGLRALMELAARRSEGPIPAREIAAAQAIPLRFLEHQLAALNKSGLVESQRGAGGGCTLARDPSDIRILDAIEALEGPLSPMWCLEPHTEDSCPQDHHCGLQELWMRVDDAVRDVFERTTLADLVTRQREFGPLLWPTTIARTSGID
jgi:Rrf2 family transcriptional regulator, cysteine metabolism repressor